MKDKIENELHALVCAGSMTLASAQHAIASNWYVAAQAYSVEAIRHSLDNGVRSIEHGNLLDRSTAESMASHEAFLVPTLITYDAMDRRGAELNMSAQARAKNREVLGVGREAVTLTRDAGVQIGFGTDLIGGLEDEQLAGLRLQAEVENPLSALRSATCVNAALLGRPDLGRLEVGAAADLVILPSNPLADIGVLCDPERPRIVIRGGDVVPSARSPH